MIYGLRWQLLLSMVAVILITVGMSAFFANRAANVEIQRLQGRDDSARHQRLSALLASRISRETDRLEAQRLLELAAAVYGQRLLLVGQGGVVAADSENGLVGQRLNPDLSGSGKIPVGEAEGPLGTLILAPNLLAEPGVAEGAAPEPSGPSLDLLLVLSGLLAGAVAMVLTFFLSRRVVVPVESLARAAQLVARGDFSARAEARSRDEVGELARTFNSMAEELSRTEELRRNLVADLAHELRTPVTNIRGYIEGIADGIIAPGAATLELMQDEVLLLSRLIEDLQDLALAESGRLPLQLQPCDLSVLAHRASDAVRQRAQARQVSVHVDAPPDLPFRADPERISQVLRNLLANAVDYTPPGGRVAVEARDRGSEVLLAVRDTGPGIPAEDLPYIFERFYRVDKSRSRATGGVGLGLTIARRLVEAHGGDIVVHSEPGKGAEFLVRIPWDGAGHRPNR